MSNSIASPVVNAEGKSRLRESLERAKRGEAPSVGQWMEFPGYSLMRTVAPLGEDWVLIDTEHGDIDDREMYLAVGAVSSAGVSPIVRIAGSEHWMIKRALDCGAHAVMVPMCETKEQAQAIANACKYPSKEFPTGNRGAGGMFCAQAFNQTGREYLLSANKNVMVCVQIESRKAIENIEEIAAVDGIDMLFIGPNDLASSMGYVAFDHASIPEVQEAIAKVLDVGRKAGKYVGHFALSAEVAAKKWEQGFEFVNCGADIVAVTAWMAGEMGKLKALVGKGRENGVEEVKGNGEVTGKAEYN